MTKILVFFFVSQSLIATVPSSSVVDNYLSEKKRFVDSEEQSRDIKAKLYATTKNLSKITKQRDELELNSNRLKRKVRYYLADLKDKKSDLERIKIGLQKRIRAYSKWHSNALGDLVLSGRNLNDLDKTLYVVKSILLNDTENIKLFRKKLFDFKQRKKHLTTKLVQLKKVKTELNAKNKEFEVLLSAHKQLLSKIEKNKISALRKMKKLRKKGAKILADQQGEEILKLRDLFKRNFFESKGRLPLPIKSQLVEFFGIKKGESRSVKLRNNGIKFLANKGDTVSSVFNGRIEFIGRVASYGKTMIIDHGGHYYSVYSNLDNIIKDIGESVITGEKIAEVGQSNSAMENKLYFEIRHFSEALDPKSWFTPESIKLATMDKERRAL